MSRPNTPIQAGGSQTHNAMEPEANLNGPVKPISVGYQAREPNRHRISILQAVRDNEPAGPFDNLEDLTLDQFNALSVEEQTKVIEQVTDLYTEAMELVRQHEGLATDKTEMNITLTELEQNIEALTRRIDEAPVHVDPRVAELEKQLADQSVILEHYKTEMRNLFSPSPHPRSASPALSASNSYQKIQELPNPPYFTNKPGSVSFEGWRVQITKKLRIDAAKFDTEDRRITYVRSRTLGAPNDYILDKLESDEFTNAEEVIADLAALYDNPTRKHEARKALNERASFQGENEPFPDFLRRFQETIRPLKLSPEEKKEELAPRLNQRHSDQVAREIDSSTFLQLVNSLHKVSQAIEKRNVLQGVVSRGSQSTPQTQTSTSNSNSNYSNSHAPSRTAEMRQYCTDNGICLKCVKPANHKPRECPEKYYQQWPESIKFSTATPYITPAAPKAAYTLLTKNSGN